MEIKKELTEIKRKNIDPTRYMEWTLDQFVVWISCLDDEKFKKYEETLREAFERDGIDGSAIVDIEKNDWIPWGIQSFKDRTSLQRHIQHLKEQNANNNKNNDQIAPAYNASNYNEGGNKTEYH